MMTEELLKAYLNTLRLDLNLFKDSIKEVSEDVIREGYSQYPVFIAHQAEVKLGEVILDKDEIGSNFTFQGSTLEELVEKQVILPKNVAKFKTAYKDPAKYCCIFLITEHGAQFVFVPFEITDAQTPENNP
jgi:hypothetical protein